VIVAGVAAARADDAQEQPGTQQEQTVDDAIHGSGTGPTGSEGGEEHPGVKIDASGTELESGKLALYGMIGAGCGGSC
jgi:hypothetical protein